MKTGNTFFSISARHGGRCNKALDGVFAKQKLQRIKLTGMSILFALGITAVVTTCDNDNTTPAPQTFTVTFNANGGSPTPPNQTIEKGKTADEPQGVTKPNTTLGGWYTEAAFATKWNFAADPVTAALTLHAQWLCNCETKTHLGIDENCTCDGNGCNCTEQIAWLDGIVNGIKIRKEKDVSVEDFNAAVAIVNEVYNNRCSVGTKTKINSRITEIHITSDVDASLNTGILKVGYNIDIDDLDDFIYDNITMVS